MSSIYFPFKFIILTPRENCFFEFLPYLPARVSRFYEKTKEQIPLRFTLGNKTYERKIYYPFHL